MGGETRGGGDIPISVLMTVYNAERYVGAAVSSVLGQSHTAFELIIVDDGSTDRSMSVVREFADPRLRVIRHDRNRGCVAAKNTGLAEAKGTFVAVLDADDLSDPLRLERQLRALHERPDVVLLGTWCHFIDADGRVFHTDRPPTEHDALYQRLSHSNPLTHSTIMVRRAAALEVGGYPPELPYAHDYGLYIRLLRAGRAAVLPEALVQYRMHGGSMTDSGAYSYEKIFDVLRVLEEARGLPGLTAEARRLNLRGIVEARMAGGALLCRSRRARDGLGMIARAGLRHPLQASALASLGLWRLVRRELVGIPGVRSAIDRLRTR